MSAQPAVPAWRRSYAPSVAATLASGGVMMAGGYLFKTVGWALAGPVMIPAGPLISAAFALAPKSPVPGQSKPRTAPIHRVLLILGMPSPGGDVSLPVTLAISVVTLLAGAVMAVAGYALAAWNPLTVPALLLAAAVVITAAFVIADRAARNRARTVAGVADAAPLRPTE